MCTLRNAARSAIEIAAAAKTAPLFLERLSHELPVHWNNGLKKYMPNDDWLLWELVEPDEEKNTMRRPHDDGGSPE